MRDLLVSHCTRFFSPFSLITFPPTIAFCFSCPILVNEMRCGSACMSFDRAHPNRVVYPYHAAISFAFDSGLASKTRPTYPNETRRGEHPRAIYPNETNRPRTICPNETVGAAPMCPPERPRSGVSISKIGFVHHASSRGNDKCALVGRHGRAHRHRPYQSPPNHAECPYLITLHIR